METGLYSLEKVQQQVERFANVINAPKNLLPTFGTSTRTGKPHIEIVRETYYYLAYDRDVTTINRQTHDISELLYWIFKDITSSMGFAYAQNRSDISVSFRKAAFHHQLELLEKLNTEWKKLGEQEIEQILEENPYQD